MQRIPEPTELMDDPAQARAYADADFETPHAAFIDKLIELYPTASPAQILEPGCGTGDITWRLVEAYPGVYIDAVDGARAMLGIATKLLKSKGANKRVKLLEKYLPCDALPSNHYDAVICNAMLHHLESPTVLWQTVKHCAREGALIFIMDLARPKDTKTAASIVAREAANEAEILKTDFYHSLLAAYTPAEVSEQLRECGLSNLEVCMHGEYHLLVHGIIC